MALREGIHEYEAVTFEEDCDTLLNMLNDLQDEEFRAQMYLRLAECYFQKEDEKNAEIYLKRYLASGKHISWIDTTYFSSILPSRQEYEQLRESF